MKPTTELIKHYNKFNEDKRLLRRHGQVEYITTMQYIHQYLPEDKKTAIIDIGAGTGRYSIALAEEGYDVTAVELVNYNLGILKKHSGKVKAFQGNALKLKRFAEASFDVTLLFGPMYHLYTIEDKVQALSEAKRVTKRGGFIFVAYLMNEYGVLTYGFKEGHVMECLADGRLDGNFHCHSEEKDLYDYMRLEDIDEVVRLTGGLKREKMIAADGPADYMRSVLNAMDEEQFQTFLRYHLSTCERPELLGASAHTVDILRKE
ncbi:MAG: methyltransferase domain-containing protein [Lachnospira sp.]|nr:methyltransferase domain-containing protein [Lachnospira sp.]